MTDILKGRHLFALALRADKIEAGHYTMGQMIAMQTMAVDRAQAIEFGLNWAHEKWPVTEGWGSHQVSASYISDIDWLTEALATETGRTDHHDLHITEPYPGYFAKGETP